MYFRLYRTGYKKAHFWHLPVVLTHSTLPKYVYLAQRAHRRDDILPFALPIDVMFLKTLVTQLMSYRFEY